MKKTLASICFLISNSLFSQINQALLDSEVTDTNKKVLVREIDISKASANEQGLIHYMETLSDEAALDFLKSFTNGALVLKEEKEISIEEIKIGCGNNFFSEADNQHAMIVRGKWCGDSYFWSPISMGNKITEDAFRKDELFTGDCTDRDSSGNLKAKYTFNQGKLTALIHFYKSGKVFQEFTYDKGIPNGISSEFDRNGDLYFRRTYKQGILNGPFYEVYYTDDSNCQKRIDEGTYSDGEKTLIKSNCY